MTFSWKNEPELMARLTTAQNHPANVNQDIMTYAGWCGSCEALEAHVIRYEEYAASYVAPKRRRGAA